MNERLKQIGTLEVLVPRIYPLDGAAHSTGRDVRTEVAVEPGHYPLYKDGEIRFVMMTGKIVMNVAFRMGEGLFMLTGDQPSNVEVKFPGIRYDERMWKEQIVESALTWEGHPEQRLRIHLDDSPEGQETQAILDDPETMAAIAKAEA